MPRHVHHEPAPPPCCCGCGCAESCYYPAPAPPPPSSAASDHLLHAIAAHLLLSSSAPPPTPQPQPQPQPQPPPGLAAHPANPYPYQYHYQYEQQQAKPHAYTHPPPPQQPNPSGDNGHLLIHSLLRRVAALESALPHYFPTPPPALRPTHPDPRPRRAARRQQVEEEEEEEEEEDESPPSPPPPRPRPRRPARVRPFSARELAARTIQAHFRRFLARRSRTLRQLKELAVLRSKAAAIRGSLSGRRGGADPAAVSEAAMSLLLRLDAIQGGDPMIREGKRAVSRELSRILEFVDKVLLKEHEQMAMSDALDTDEYHEGCNAAFVADRPAVIEKKVSFSGNGQVHELNGETENGNEVDEGCESSSSAESVEVKGMPAKKSANGKPGLAAPMPVHMETRKIAGERR
ncbi:uncharacterized protein LOC133885893 [Phragmites australis]|uniref:uncharacterized protein LOC133885893 n=1 Tax=Phragmites australis TaxID=29695 RepID=UPI002D77A7B8|nr:uncharacterized protein LOC133885893 [Phragmites australis]